MRKIEVGMIDAVQACLDGSERTWRWGNTEVTTHHHGVAGEPGYERTVVVRLHDNVIAEFDSALNGDHGCRGMKLRDAGWQTATTKSRLNALLGAFREGSCIYQKAGQWYGPDGTEWNGVEWFSYGSTNPCVMDYLRAKDGSSDAPSDHYDLEYIRAKNASSVFA